MAKQRKAGTTPEARVLDALGERGLAFERNVRPVVSIRREADGVLKDSKVALFIDGCFWHGCPEHSRDTKSSTLWWREKIDRNKARDAETDALLGGAGWNVIRVWEHEDPAVAVGRVVSLVAEIEERGHDLPIAT